MSELPRNMSVNEFTHKHNITPKTFYNEINSGQLESIKIRGKRLVMPDQEAAWIKRKIAAGRVFNNG